MKKPEWELGQYREGVVKSFYLHNCKENKSGIKWYGGTSKTRNNCSHCKAILPKYVKDHVEENRPKI